MREFAATQLDHRGESTETEVRRADFLAVHLKPRRQVVPVLLGDRALSRGLGSASDDIRASLRWCLEHGEVPGACALICGRLQMVERDRTYRELFAGPLESRRIGSGANIRPPHDLLRRVARDRRHGGGAGDAPVSPVPVTASRGSRLTEAHDLGRSQAR